MYDVMNDFSLFGVVSTFVVSAAVVGLAVFTLVTTIGAKPRLAIDRLLDNRAEKNDVYFAIAALTVLVLLFGGAYFLGSWAIAGVAGGVIVGCKHESISDIEKALKFNY